MSSIFTTIVRLATLSILAISVLPAQSQNSTTSKALSTSSLPVRNLSIFKNGSCFITKEGTVPVSNSEVRLNVPSAINATYWLTTVGDKLIRSVRYSDEKMKVNHEVVSMLDLIEANIGKTMSFELHHESHSTTIAVQPQTISGKIVGINHNLNSFKLETSNGVRLFGVDAIAPNSSIIQDIVDQKMVDSLAHLAVISTLKPVDQLTLREISLQRNMQWIPSYAVHITNDKELRIEMKALIENFSGEDITNADAEVVVGVPQLYYSFLNDPSTTSYYTQLQPYSPYNSGLASAGLSNMSIRGGRAASTMTMDQNEAAQFKSTFGDQPMFGAETEQAHDNFVYKLGTISIANSTKVSFPVFATTLKYKNEMECDISDVLNYENSRSSYTTPTDAEVYHSIEVENKSAYPLTTGGLMVEDENGHFLSQDELKYTPKGGTAKIRLAKSLSVAVKHNEEELSRSDNVKKIGRQSYGRASIRGTINVVNYDTKAQTIVVRKVVNGSITKSDDATVHRNVRVSSTNPESKCEWTVVLNPGQSRELNYEYDCVYRQ